MELAPLRRYLGFYHTQRGWIALSIALASATILAQVGLLALSGWFLAAMGIAGIAGASINYFTPAAIIRGLAMLRTAGRYGERLVTHDTTLRMTSRFRHYLYQKLENTTPDALQDLSSADVFSRLRADVDRLERFFLQAFLPMLVSAITLSVVAAVLFWLSGTLAVGVLVLVMVAGIGLPCLQLYITRRHHAAIGLLQSELRHAYTETVQGISDIFVYGNRTQRQEMLNHLSARIAAHETRLYRADAVMQLLLGISIGAAICWSILTGLPLMQHGRIPPAFIAMLPLLCVGAFETVAALPAAIASLTAANLSAGRIFGLIDRAKPPAMDATLSQLELPFVLECMLPAVAGRLEKPVHFHWRAGEVVAVIGPSGAGKSSLVQWLTGLLPLPENGDILRNGHSLRHVEEFVWRRQFAVAQQRPYIFSGTLRENLHIAQPGATDEALLEACRIAHFPVSTFPQGLDTRVGEHGSTLSGGERRRLSIARALLLPAPCLVLDEPTEGLQHDLGAAMLTEVLAVARQRNQAVMLITHDGTLHARFTHQVRL